MLPLCLNGVSSGIEGDQVYLYFQAKELKYSSLAQPSCIPVSPFNRLFLEDALIALFFISSFQGSGVVFSHLQLANAVN